MGLLNIRVVDKDFCYYTSSTVFPSLLMLVPLMSQMELGDLKRLLPATHPYRGFQAYLSDATKALVDVSQLKGADGDGVERLFRCLLLPFMEDLSDRELERYLEETLAAKWF